MSVLAYTSALFKRQRARFGQDDDDESCSSTISTTAPKMPCHAPASPSASTSVSKKRTKPTLNEFLVLVKLWKHGMVHGDAEFVANRYSPSAVLTCGDVTFRGREQIQEYYQQEFFPKHHPRSIKVLYGKFGVYGEQVHDNGIYDITTRSGKFLRMKYTFVYARDNTTGRWRIVHHKTANVCDIAVTGTPINRHANHTRTVQLEDENDNDNDHDDDVSFDSNDDDNQSFAGEASSVPSEIIPWGAFPFENGCDEFERQQQQEQQIEEGIDTQPCHSAADRAMKEEPRDVPPSRWNQTPREQPIVEPHKNESAHKRRPSEIDRLVTLLTGTNGDERTITTTTEQYVPERRPSQVDHLVGLLTGTKKVTQTDLILLSVNNNSQ